MASVCTSASASASASASDSASASSLSTVQFMYLYGAIVCPGFHLKYTFNRMLRFWKKMLQYYQCSIHLKYWLPVEHTSKAQENNTTVMLIWCLKQRIYFTFRFSIRGVFFSFYNYRYLVLFLQVDVLMKLPTTEQIITVTNMIFISFSITHESSTILSNYQSYF